MVFGCASKKPFPSRLLSRIAVFRSRSRASGLSYPTALLAGVHLWRVGFLHRTIARLSGRRGTHRRHLSLLCRLYASQVLHWFKLGCQLDRQSQEGGRDQYDSRRRAICSLESELPVDLPPWRV